MQDEAKVFSFRASDGNTVKLEYRESLPSAAALAKEYAISGYPDRYAIFTEKQTAVSALDTPLLNGESDKGLFLSCILRPSIFPSQVGVVAPLGAVALMLALEEHTSKKMGIGWVSDIYCEGVKIGGADTEGKLDDFSSYEYLIVSFSVKLDEKNFPPRLTDMVPDESKYRIFINAVTSISLDDHNCISTSDNRLLRRIVRDYSNGSFSAQESIRNWPNVRRSEVQWIYPYQECADVLFNSSYIVEFPVIRAYAERVLMTVPKNCPEYADVSRLMRMLSYFVPVSDKDVPATSLIRTFIGGSSL